MNMLKPDRKHAGRPQRRRRRQVRLLGAERLRRPGDQQDRAAHRLEPRLQRQAGADRRSSGFDYALSQIRFTAGYGADNQHESVSLQPGAAAATERLKVIAAILPGLWNPALAAKLIATINHLTNGRIAVNVVSGWFRGEFTAIGEPWLDHDERYRRSEEFIRALRGIWTEDNFTFARRLLPLQRTTT